MSVRLANGSDKPALKALWQTCFHESASFLDWFFDNRFLPAYCVCITEGDRIVSALHGLPLHVRVRDTILPAVIIGGVATLPEARGQGHMHEVFAAFMRILRGYGAAIALCRPEQLSTYRKLGMFACADVQFLSLPADAPRPAPPASAQECDLSETACALYRCYDACFQRYSCAASRTYADFAYKCAEYRSDGARCIALLHGADVCGYCVCFETEDGIYGDECAALSPEAFRTLYDAMAARFPDKGLKLRLPPDVSIDAPEAVTKTVPYIAAAALDVSRLLRATGLDLPVPIEVTDGVIFENNGVFLPAGRATHAAPMLHISAGRLTQWVTGYRSMAELIDACNATALDRRAISALDAAGKRVCHIAEEY